MSSMCIIERQADSGVWIRVCDGANNPTNIKRLLDAAVKAYPLNKKFRAIDAQTKQLIDISMG